MYRPLLCVLAALALGAGLVQAQPNVPAIPEPCQVAGSETLPDLETRKARLERDITQAQEKITEAKGTPKGEARLKSLAKGLRGKQEGLLKVVFQIECARARAEVKPPVPVARGGVPKSPAAERRPARPQEELVQITTYYATNRKPTASKEPTKIYGSDEEPVLRYGRAVVTIPPTHVRGSLELPTLWKLERQVDPNRHFVLKSVMQMGKAEVRRELAEQLNGSGNKAILLFVHGYNTGFPEAAMRAAQLAYDLDFAGVPFFYSWPSANQLLSYWQDEEAARLSEAPFAELLEDLSQLPATDIYVVAHSMGNRIVGAALRERVDAGKPTRQIRELLMAAPDINAELFRRDLAPRLAQMKDTRTTIYASSSDLALRASKIVHGFRRLGETIGGLFTHRSIETIDASTVAVINRAYGHSYLMDSIQVLKDVSTIIKQKQAAKERGLPAVGQDPDIFYRLN